MTTMLESTIPSIRRISDHVGMEAMDVDLSQPLDAETKSRLYDALVEGTILVIRDQSLSPKQYLTAMHLFGKPMRQHFDKYSLPDQPLINEVTNTHFNKNGTLVKHGEGWHTDHTNHEQPPKFTCLMAVNIPSQGGDTRFLNMRAAYAALPEDVRKRVDPMQTLNVFKGSASRNTSTHTSEAMVERKDTTEATGVRHPLVRTNPDNSTRALYFHPSKTENIVGMDPESSQELLHDLLNRAGRPEFEYRHKWRSGDIIIWDNRSVMHQASFDYNATDLRVLYRIIIEGDRPH
ncbi:MAG: TauD/TfdA dioxygenase family protein [Rhodospirillales bacterium]|jgi:taurine dioxygenase